MQYQNPHSFTLIFLVDETLPPVDDDDAQSHEDIQAVLVVPPFGNGDGDVDRDGNIGRDEGEDEDRGEVPELIRLREQD